MLKLHLVMGSYSKIMWDAISNITLLWIKDVPLHKIAQYTAATRSELREITKYKNEILATSISNLSEDSKKIKIRNINNELKTIPLYYLYERGLSQSIADSIISKNPETITGLQHDIDNVISKVFRSEDKELNQAGKFIMNASKSIVNVESIFSVISNMSKSVGADSVSNITKDFANKMRAIKGKDNIEAYLSEFLGSPTSTVIQTGTALTLGTDQLSRGVLYKYQISQGMSKDDAVKDALLTFLDYRVNNPADTLEQYGIFMFSSFWVRIQRVILLSMRDKSFSSSAAITASMMMEAKSSTIFPSNVITRLSNGQVINTQELQPAMVSPIL